MSYPMRLWPQPLFGLDIQADEICLLQLKGSSNNKRVKNAIACALPRGAVIDGKIHQADVVEDCLRKLVFDHQLQNFKVAIAVPEPCVVSQRICVAKGLDETQLAAEVINHLSQCMPGVTEGLCYDFTIVDATHVMQDEIMIVATPYANLNLPVRIVQNVGLKVRTVDVAHFALQRAMQYIEENEFAIEKKWLLSFGLALWSYQW